MIKFNELGDLAEINGVSTDAEDYGNPLLEIPEMSDLNKFIDITATGNSTTSTTIECSKYKNAYYEKTLPGTAITVVGIIDPDNTSTGDNNLNNNNLTDLVYNNSSSGSTNKSLPAADIGSIQTVGIVRVHWWTNSSYMCSNYKIQGSDDGTTWVDLVINLDSTASAGAFQDISLPSGTSHRYFRVFSVTGVNASWVTISEIDIFAPGPTVYEHVSKEDSLSLVCDTSTTPNVVNIINSGSDKQLKIYHNG